MKFVYDRVCAWNAKRYEQVLNLQLAESLLSEEFDEWYEAETDVNRLDALCDLVYVAMGVIWKAKPTDEESARAAELVFDLVENLLNAEEHLSPLMYCTPYIVLMGENKCSALTTAHMVICLSCVEMTSMGLTHEQIEEALLVVCDSNDSKSIKKTDPSVKANAGDKGPYFVAPEPRLQEILNARA